MATSIPKYQRLADQTQDLLQSTGHPGDRVLSIRDYACREKVSISTAQRVYELLELRGLIESKPRSGYYLSGTEQSQAIQHLDRRLIEIPTDPIKGNSSYIRNEHEASIKILGNWLTSRAVGL